MPVPELRHAHSQVETRQEERADVYLLRPACTGS